MIRSAGICTAIVLLGGPAAAQSVVVSEFMADNATALEDFEDEQPDWIELHNTGGAAVDLGGWFLTDDAQELDKWSFPSPTVLDAGAFLVVFASDKDQVTAGGEIHTNFKLSSSGEYLALVEPDGATVAHDYAPEFPEQFADVSYGLAWPLSPSPDLSYFGVPTPGEENGALGFAVVESTHSPALPDVGDEITVTARLIGELGLVGSVSLEHRTMYGATSVVTMVDDGTGGDAVAGDDVYTGVIPAASAAAGEMLRWKITALGQQGTTARYPLFLFEDGSPEYLGTMMPDPAVSSELPILHWFVEDPFQATSTTGTRCSLWFRDRFYDNVFVRRRGGSSAFWTKQNFKFDFNRGHLFLHDPVYPQVEEFDLNSTWSDKAYVRAVMAWEDYRDAGGDHCVSYHVRVEQNAEFYSVAMFLEQPDERFLERNGLDPVGALYKMYNEGTDAYVDVEKKTRLDEDHSDLEDFLAGVNQGPGAARTAFLFDNLDLAACINYLAATAVMHDNDHISKNYYLYRDSEGDLEWRFLPWDKDLVYGRNMNGVLVLNDDIWADQDPQSHPLFGDSDHLKIDGFYNRIIDAMHDTPEIQELYLRRLRSVMDAFLESPTVPESERRYESRMAELEALLGPDVALDEAKWGVPSWGDPALDFAAALDQMRDEYLDVRRVHLYQTHSALPGGIIPPEQVGVPAIGFGDQDPDPASGDPLEEYLELTNPAPAAVDVSGWVVGGSIAYTMPAGTVIGSGGSLYLVRDPVSFRARQTGPSGGQNLFVTGPFVGDLVAGGSLHLWDDLGNLVNTTDGPVLEVRDLVAGETASFRVMGVATGAEQVIAYSLTGAGPTATQYGTVFLSAPVLSLGRAAANLAGVAEVQRFVPAGASGVPVWLQALDLGTGALSNPLAEVVD